MGLLLDLHNEVNFSTAFRIVIGAGWGFVLQIFFFFSYEGVALWAVVVSVFKRCLFLLSEDFASAEDGKGFFFFLYQN